MFQGEGKSIVTAQTQLPLTALQPRFTKGQYEPPHVLACADLQKSLAVKLLQFCMVYHCRIALPPTLLYLMEVMVERRSLLISNCCTAVVRKAPHGC